MGNCPPRKGAPAHFTAIAILGHSPAVMEPSDRTAFETIQRNVRKRLDATGRNMKSVSLEAGLGETFVRDMLQRHRKPSPDALAKLAATLQTSVGYLTGEAPHSGMAEVAAVYEGDLVSVAEYDVRLSAGGGMLVESENQTGVWQFSRRYLVDELRLRPSNLAIVEVQGDSMVPTLWPGDRVLVDHGDRNPALPGIYAIWDSNATVVKRVERVPTSDPPQLVLISDNKNHNAYTVSADLVNVIGRVVWYGRRL